MPSTPLQTTAGYRGLTQAVGQGIDNPRGRAPSAPRQPARSDPRRVLCSRRHSYPPAECCSKARHLTGGGPSCFHDGFTMAERDEKGLWKKGQSGNPSGKPKSDIKALARQHTETALKALVDIVRSPKTPAAARVQAATALLDRGYGKPTQHVEAKVARVSDLTDDELRLIAALGTGSEADTDGPQQSDQLH